MIEGMLADSLRRRGTLPALVCHIGARAAEGLDRLPLGEQDRILDLERCPLAEETEDRAPVGLVAVVAATATDLRRASAAVSGLPASALVTVVLRAVSAHQGPLVPVVPGSGQWSGLLDVRARRGGGDAWSCELCFGDAVAASGVVAALAHGVVGGRRSAAILPSGRVCGPGAGDWRPGTRRPAAADLVDMVLDTSEAPPPPADGDQPRRVLRRGTAASSWRETARPRTRADAAPNWGFSVDDVPPVDERVVNPVGFSRVSGPVVGRLASRGGRWVLEAGRSVRWRVPEDGSVTDVDVAGLRGLRGVRVEWGRHSGPLAGVRAVAGLAAAGIPLVSGPVPLWGRCLGRELTELITSMDPEALADELAREEHSVRSRRAALRAHGVRARWRGLGASAGLDVPADPVVSVVLCTRRPEMVGFALRQVGRQRGVDLELVLGLHGFTEDAPGVSGAVEALRASGREVVVFEAGPDEVFGSVLNRAIARVSGPLVAKMDDDDWYGPDHLADLVLARHYSGADLAGTLAEFVYLEALDLTVRRKERSECLAPRVAGGTLLMDRATVEEVGGFRPVPVSEDSALLAEIERLGGRIYRGHGCNYVLRRKAAGHTWTVGAGYFLREGRQRRPGWRPSALLEPDGGDAPASRSVRTWSGPEPSAIASTGVAAGRST